MNKAVGVGIAALLLSACSTGNPASAVPPTPVATQPIAATPTAAPAADTPTSAPQPQPTSLAAASAPNSAAASGTTPTASTPVAAPTTSTAAGAPTTVAVASARTTSTAGGAPTAAARSALTPVAAPVSPAHIATPTAGEQVDSPEAATATSNVATKFEGDVNSGKVTDALALFADGAEVKVPPDRYVGSVQIANWLNYLASIHFEIEPGFRRVVGTTASWPAEVRSDYLDHIGLPSLDGEASLIIVDGRITNYTFYLTEDSARRHRDAVLAATEVEQDPLIVGQDAANVYGFNDVFFDPENNMVSYKDVLTADSGAGPFHDLGGEPVIIHSGY